MVRSKAVAGRLSAACVQDGMDPKHEKVRRIFPHASCNKEVIVTKDIRDPTYQSRLPIVFNGFRYSADQLAKLAREYGVDTIRVMRHHR